MLVPPGLDRPPSNSSHPAPIDPTRPRSTPTRLSLRQYLYVYIYIYIYIKAVVTAVLLACNVPATGIHVPIA